MIQALVSNNEHDFYPALINPAECNEEGYVRPYFDLATVRRIEENTRAAAAQYGHGSVDTVHVVDGGSEDGTPRALVVVISWMDLPDKDADPVQFVEPDEESGLYPVGGLAWCWYALDEEMNPNLPFRTANSHSAPGEGTNVPGRADTAAAHEKQATRAPVDNGQNSGETRPQRDGAAELIDTWVTVDERHVYPARLDPSRPSVNPALTLNAIRQLSAHTAQDLAATNYQGDQITVIDGTPGPVVLHIRWIGFAESRVADAVNVVQPDEQGLYWVGASEWYWVHIPDGPLFYTQNEAFDAWQRVLAETGRRMGEIVRTQMPEATSCLVDLTHLGHIVQVEATGHAGWPTGTRADGEGGYGPFDTETLGEADELMRQALDQGRDPIELELGGWRPARDIKRPELHRIKFAPRGAAPTGDGPLEEARTQATAVGRQLLTETAPYLARDVRAVWPNARSVTVTLTPQKPLLLFIADDGAATGGKKACTQIVRDRLTKMFAFRPSHDDLIACGWRPTPHGFYTLPFTA